MNYMRHYFVIFALSMYAQLSLSMDKFYDFIEHDKELFPQLSNVYPPTDYHVDSFSSEFPQELHNNHYQSCSLPATPSTPFENCYSAMVPLTPDVPVTPASLTPRSDEENQNTNKPPKPAGAAQRLISPQTNRKLVNKIIRDVQKRTQPSTQKTSLNQEKYKQQKNLRATIKNISTHYRIDLTQQIKPMTQLATRVTVDQIVPSADSSLAVPNKALAQVLPTLPAESFVIVPAQSFYYKTPLVNEILKKADRR